MVEPLLELLMDFFLDITSFMGRNRSYEALKHAWVEWRKASGNKYKKDYIDFIKLNNDGAQSLGKIFILKIMIHVLIDIIP